MRPLPFAATSAPRGGGADPGIQVPASNDATATGTPDVRDGALVDATASATITLSSP